MPFASRPSLFRNDTQCTHNGFMHLDTRFTLMMNWTGKADRQTAESTSGSVEYRCGREQ